MKQKHLRILSQAQEEINKAFEWYFKRRPAAADAFLTEIGTSLRQIVSRPQLYPPYTTSTRRRVLPRFPYSVIFLEKDDVITCHRRSSCEASSWLLGQPPLIFSAENPALSGEHPTRRSKS